MKPTTFDGFIFQTIVIAFCGISTVKYNAFDSKVKIFIIVSFQLSNLWFSAGHILLVTLTLHNNGRVIPLHNAMGE